MRPKKYRHPEDGVVEAVRLDHENARLVCDWINDTPGAWCYAYSGNAYPDLCGIKIPISSTAHIFVLWGNWVVKGGAPQYPQFDVIDPKTFAAEYEAEPVPPESSED